MSLGFLDRIFSLISSAGDPEADKRKQLKEIARDLAKNKYKFYKPRGDEVQGLLAKFFYDIYKTISPAQVFLQNADKSAQLRQIVIDSFLDPTMLALQERLSEESIKERAQTVPTKELSHQLKEDLIAFIAGFDSARTRSIDDCYNLIGLFTHFINYDYFFVLKKFDSGLPERNFSYHAQFEPIRAEYVGDDIKDFLEVLYPVVGDLDWKAAFTVLKTYKGVDVVAADQWGKLVNLLRDVRKSGVLELMVRHIDKNPTWTGKTQYADERLVEPYVQRLRAQTEVAIQKILQEKRNAKIDELATAVFGTPAVSRLKNYTDKANIVFTKKMLGGYTHIMGLNYLKAFLLDYFKKDIRELCDLFLVRGQWSTNLLSQQLSEGFHELLTVSEKLLAFDEALADDGERGTRLRTALAKVDRDKDQVKNLRIQLKAVNDEAQQMINTAAQALIAVGKNLKNVLEDYQANPHELIINWKQIELSTERPIDQRVTEVYKKIYYFVQLMQFYAKADAPTPQV